MRRFALNRLGQRRPDPRAVLALGLLALSAVALVALMSRAPRRAGTNMTLDTGYVVSLGGAQRLCEPDELLPADTGALRLAAVSGPGGSLPSLDISIEGATGPLTDGKLAAGAAPGTILIPLARVVRRTQAVTVCARDTGSTPVAFGGSVPGQRDSGQGRLRIEYMRPGRESWLQLLPTLAYRSSLGKSHALRHWGMGAALALMLMAAVLAARIVGEEGRRV